MTNRQAAIKIIKRLRKEDFEALLAGGCVRDMLLKRQAKDYDIATSAHPDDIIRLFRRTIKVGAKFGVVMVMDGKEQVEVATFRTESGYVDGRRPNKVTFADAKADAVRRDFTINGMFYDPVTKKVIDYVKGQADLKKKIIRTIGTAAERFDEDYLRMLRAIRFSIQLGFDIEHKTFMAIKKHAGKITKISSERIAIELEATLTNPNRSTGARLLYKSGLANVILPGISDKQAAFGINVLGHLRQRIDFPLALAGLFAGLDTDFAMHLSRNLRLSNAHAKGLKFLLDKRNVLLDAEMGLANLKMILTEPFFWDLYDFQRAIQKVNGQSTAPLLKIKKRAESLKGKHLKPKPLLNGHELIDLGVKPGPMVGLASQEMYIAQLSEIIHTRIQAAEWIRRWLHKHEQIEN